MTAFHLVVVNSFLSNGRVARCLYNILIVKNDTSYVLHWLSPFVLKCLPTLARCIRCDEWLLCVTWQQRGLFKGVTDHWKLEQQKKSRATIIYEWFPWVSRQERGGATTYYPAS